MFDIITIGSATRDFFIKTAAFDVHKSHHVIGGQEACLPLGAKIDVADLIFDTGGGATNTAASFANFGLKTAAVCRVGQDFAGEEILRNLKKYKINTRFVSLDSKHRTAYSIILMAESGQRTILVYRGASGHFTIADIPWPRLKSQWIYLSSLGGDLKLLTEILDTVARKKIKIAWNPGGLEIKAGFKKLEPLIKKVDVLIMNEEEAKTLVDKNFIKALRDLPRRALAITQGDKGAIAADKKEMLFAPAYGGKAMEATGAGDAFSAGFVTGLLKWDNLSLALRLGALNSGMCVQKTGAKAGLLPKLPSKTELKRLSIKNS